jgi:mitochondrial import receptor subunit TOM40
MVETYDGFRCNINKQVSPFMAVIHSFHLGTSMDMAGRKNLYTFLTQVADENGMLMARVDPSRLSVDGRIHKALGPVLGRMQVSVSPEGQTDQMMAEFDINGATWSGNLKYGTGGGGNVYGVNYLQSVTPKLAIGGEGMYVAANQNTINSYSIKYDWMAPVSNADAIDATPKPTGRGPNGPDPAGASYLCASYNSAQGALSLNYKRTVTPGRLVLGAELTCSPFTLDSQVTVGAEFKWQRSKLNLAVDGGGRIQSVLEAKYGMSPGAPTLQFSADVDHFKEEMKFGYGISIDS